MNNLKIMQNLSLVARDLVCKQRKKLLSYLGLNQIRRKPEKKITSTVLQWLPSSRMLSQLHHTPDGGNLWFTRPSWPVECSPIDDSGCQFDVFISFRGEDTRENFTSHLYEAMRRSGIKAFIDSEALEKGEEIGPSLSNAIARSKISVVVFSQNYAASKWCLRELLKIVECRRTRGQIVLPIFYHIEPKEVRWQIGNYREAFAEHDKKVVKGSVMAEEVRLWRHALRFVANLAGFCSDEIRPESKLVQEVVDCVLQKLQSHQSSSEEEDDDDHSQDYFVLRLVPSVMDPFYYLEKEARKKVAQLVETAMNTTSSDHSSNLLSEAKLRHFAFVDDNVAPLSVFSYHHHQPRVLTITSSPDVRVLTTSTGSDVVEHGASAAPIVHSPGLKIFL